MKLIPDIVYAEREGVALKLDLYLPSAEDLPCPVVVWVSGGGWRGGGKAIFPDPWFIDSGIAVMAIDYTLSPVAPFPAAVEDIQASLRWLRAHGGEYQILTDRIGLWGGSAGGHLVSLAGLSEDVQAICSVNGIYDLVRTADPEQKAGFLGLYDFASQFLGGPVEEKLDLAKEASPIRYVHAGAPPFLLFHGTQDEYTPLAEAFRFRDALQKAGVPVEFHTMQDAKHAYTLPQILEMNQKILDFFVRTLRPVSGGGKCTCLYSANEF